MLNLISHYLTVTVFGLNQNSALQASVQFFIYDSIKILILLIVITHLMSLVRYFLPIEKLRDFLLNKKFYGFDYFLASLFGAVTPFCSCSSIPLFIGFLGARIPLGITFSFLITSPLVNEVALALFIGLFGLKITMIYLISGMAIGIIGGYILGKLHLEKYVENFIYQTKLNHQNLSIKKLPAKKIAVIVSKEAFEITRKIVPYLLAGIAIGAIIHGYIPAGYFEKYLATKNIFAVPMAVILAIPLYSNASGVIPIIQALVAKGVPLGTALAFMMAAVGLSLPEALILKKVMKWPLLASFFGIVGVGIIILGYLFNIFL
ncbi:MAG: permease [Candidatus Buchananbacteria bacterium]|nr:permease [Candidatus Buchananbacteria bacterium]